MRIITVALCLAINLPAAAAPLLLISIDGLHPRYVIEADRHGLEIPHLRSFIEQGAYARGVIGVLPTVTYPNHTTLITGVLPAEHGITSNAPFDPLGTNRDGWFWYAQDIRVASLWKASAQAGLVTASVNWPVTVGERHIRFLLPEYWRASTPEDLKLLRSLSRPEGLLEQLEKNLGPFVDGNTDDLRSDEIRTKFSLAILREHRPQLMAVHLIALDGVQHRNGPWVAAAFETIEAIDRMVGELATAALANDPATVIAIVSDHGFIAAHTAVNLRTRFVETGLIRIAQPAQPYTTPTLEAWDAQLWSGGPVAAVMLRDPTDARVRTRVATLLDELKAEPRNGIARILDKPQLAASGSYPEAEFLVEFAPGYYLGTALQGDLLSPANSKGTHGYMPDRPEMHAAFFMMGKDIAAGRDLGTIDMRRIAPTLAHILGVALPSAREPMLPIRR